MAQGEGDEPEEPAVPAVLEFKAAIGGEKRAEWLAEGERKALLMLLGSRGLSATAEEERATIEGCSDLAVLDRWFLRAVTAGSVAEILGGARRGGRGRGRSRRAAKPRAGA